MLKKSAAFNSVINYRWTIFHENRFKGRKDKRRFAAVYRSNKKILLIFDMYFLRSIFLYVSLLSITFLSIGLYKPWVMLWWQDVQNRRRVIKLYGGIAILSYAVYWLTFFMIWNSHSVLTLTGTITSLAYSMWRQKLLTHEKKNYTKCFLITDHMHAVFLWWFCR